MMDKAALTTTSTVGMRPSLEIRAATGWNPLSLKELWRYRGLVWLFTSRDIKTRYRQMALGWLWIVIRPITNIVIFSVLFGEVAKLPSEGVPYPLFACAAILPWTFFSSAASSAGSSLINRMGLVSKVYFPRLVPPISAVLTSLVDFLLSLLVMLGLMAYYRHLPSAAVWMLPFYLLLGMATALAVGLWTATVTVRFRDLRFVLDTALQVWMYATPVAYSASLIPKDWQALYQLNPLFWVVEGFRWGVLGVGTAPAAAMGWPTAIVLTLLVSGAYVFKRSERNIVDLQ